MNYQESIAELVQFNQWANTEIANWLKRQDQALLEKHVQGSFETINKTLWHMLNAQAFWHSLCAQYEFVPIPDQLLDHLILDSTKLAVFASSQTVEQLSEKRKVKTKRLDGDFEVGVMLQHVVNHATYHRGQLITVSHQLGMKDQPWTDYIHYQMLLQ